MMLPLLLLVPSAQAAKPHGRDSHYPTTATTTPHHDNGGNSTQISPTSPVVPVYGCGRPVTQGSMPSDAGSAMLVFDPNMIMSKCSSVNTPLKEPENPCEARAKKPSWKSTQSSKVIRLVKQKSIAKSPMFMKSPSSIYAAVCKYDSLLDALHGINNLDYLHQEEYILVIIYIHFGGCSIFEQQFDSILANMNSLSPTVIEEALHRSVRHLCGNECFLRAYHPIREFTFLWRDMTIQTVTAIETASECNTITGSPSHYRQLKKENLLSGWICKVAPASAKNISNTVPKSTKKRAERALPLVFISPDGTEFNTKSKAINFMNKSLSSSQLYASSSSQTSSILSTTPLITFTARLNKLYSPLGLLEELFLDDPWKLMVSTICLNVTTRQQVDAVLYEFLRKWPDAVGTANANWEEISSVVAPLGLGTKRAKGLIRFSEEYLALTGEYDAFSLSEKQVKSLFNIGQYGWTAYEVFILNELPSGTVKVCDHALQLYVEYQLGRNASEQPLTFN